MEQTFNQDLSHLRRYNQMHHSNNEDRNIILASSRPESTEIRVDHGNISGNFQNQNGFHLPQIKYSEVYEDRYIDDANYTIQRDHNLPHFDSDSHQRGVANQRMQLIEEREGHHKKQNIMDPFSHLPSKALLKEAGFTEHDISQGFYASSNHIKRSISKRYQKNIRESLKDVKSIKKSRSRSKSKLHNKSRDKRIPKLHKRYLSGANQIDQSTTPFTTQNKNSELQTSQDERGISDYLVHKESNPFQKDYDSFITAKNSQENGNDDYVNSSYFSKHKPSNQTRDPSYIDQFNDSPAYLAVGEVSSDPIPDEDKMKGLREFFKKKIVNAYNSIYHEHSNPGYDTRESLSKTEKMIQKIIIRE
ncbi:unnamed protein product [Moneuplotes crassus]|uniref:Uncharacterized protein n=1 Tax=Euplotes crassus TaxID=5936 RepID=A0AAD1XXR1_EUPCR|nr:unnamed protein product [Moneuplotes crassus]